MGKGDEGFVLVFGVVELDFGGFGGGVEGGRGEVDGGDNFDDVVAEVMDDRVEGERGDLGRGDGGFFGKFGKDVILPAV